MDNIILQKVASIERCVQRVNEEYHAAAESLANDFSRQDAAILNLQRACEQSIDLANHIIRLKKLGLPSTSRESFDLLHKNNIVGEELAAELKKMVGFRNIAIHEYSKLNVEILENIIENHLGVYTDFSKIALQLVESKD